MHEVLVNRLGGLSLPRKSVVRLSDRPDMTLDVYRGRKTTMQQQQQQQHFCHVAELEHFQGMQLYIFIFSSLLNGDRGWSGGAMVLGKLPVPGRPTILITVGQGPIALAVGAGWGGLDIFTLIYPFSSFSLSSGDGSI